MTDAVELVNINIADLGLFLDGMNEIVADMEDEQVGEIRVQLDALLSMVRGAIGACDSRLIQLLTPGAVLSAGGGEMIVEVKGKQISHGEKLARTIAARVADSPADEDGVMLPPAVLTERTADEMVKAFGLHTPSTRIATTAIKAMGLKPAAFREFEDGVPKVRVL